jgi:hypothetical protein
MADFEIRRESNSKQVPLESLKDVLSDTITTSRGGGAVKPDPFFAKAEKPNLGMEYFVDESEQGEPAESVASELEHEDPFMHQTQPSRATEMSFEETQREKANCLSQLKRFEKRGIVVGRRFGMEHSLDDIKGEVYRIKKENQVDAGINYCRQGLMFCVSTIEMMNNKFKVGGNMDGWSHVILNDIENYDEVFEELYEKWYSNMGSSPEIKLISMLAGSAFMFHLQKSMTAPSGRQREMSGPTEEMLRSLDDSDDNESIVSMASSVEPEVKSINIQTPEKKGRGRPKKLK